VQEIWQGKLDAYSIQELLVNGRFGDTFRARRVRDDLEVIIKTIAIGAELGWSQISAFEREAERLRRLEHPAVASYIDDFVVDLSGQPRDRVALVQLPAAGRPLSAHPLPMGEPEALAWLEQLLEALVAMHERIPAVVHGDLDLGNLILDDAGKLTVVDLASVRQALLSADRLAGGLHAGGLSYAAPEQRMGRVEPGTDLYAAAIAYVVARTGTQPAQLPLRGAGLDLAALSDVLSDAERAFLAPLLEPDPFRRTRDARIPLRAVQLHAEIARQRAQVSVAAARLDEPRDAQAALARALEERHAALVEEQSLMRLDMRKAWLLNVMRRWRLATADPAVARVSRADAWRAPRPGALDRIHTFAASAAGGHMIFGHARQALIVDGATGAARAELSAPESIRRAAISPDGRRVALLHGLDALTLYEVNTSAWAKHQLRVEGMWPGHSPLVFSPTGELVATGDDDQLDLYRFDTGKLVSRTAVDARHGVVFAPDNRTIFAIGEGTISQVSDGEVLGSHKGDGIAFLPDGRRVALVQGGALWLASWSGHIADIIRQGEKIALPLAQLAGQLSHVCVSPDGRRVLVAGHEGVMMCVELDRGATAPLDPARALLSSGVKLLDAGWSADGSRLYVHGTLPLDAAPGTPNTGAVFAWNAPAWLLGGAYLWRGARLGIISADGFYGDLQSVRRGANSSGQGWERPEVALAILEGQSADALLSAEERVRYAEYCGRRDLFAAIVPDVDQRWQLIDAAEGQVALLPLILREAVAADMRAALARPDSSPGVASLREALAVRATSRADEIARAASALRDEVPDEQGALWRWLGLDAATGAEPPQIAPPITPRSAPPTTAPPAYTPAVARANQRGPSGAPPDSKPPQRDLQIAQPADAGALVLRRRAVFQALIFAAFVGYFPVYMGIFWVGAHTLDEGTFWFLLLSVGPLLAILAYHAVARRIYNL
jgi:hypothetical protein